MKPCSPRRSGKGKRRILMVHRRAKKIIFLLLLILFFLNIQVCILAKDRFRFVVLGDSRPIFIGLPQAEPFKRILEEINLISPDFVINVGDLVAGYFSSEKELRRQYEDYILTTKKVLIPYYNVVGNHEVPNKMAEELYQEYLGKLYYSFSYNNSHFIILDTDIGGYDSGTIGDEQYKWLKEELKKNKDKQIFVFMHKPMFHYEDNQEKTSWKDKRMRSQVHQLFKEYKVKMVFAGDVHTYKRLNIDGITYYITGGGGAEQGFDEIGTIGFYHFLLVKVKGDKIKVDLMPIYHIWTDYYPSNTGYHNKVEVNIYCTAKSLLPLRIKGLTVIMPKLKDNEKYKVSPGAKILRIKENANNTNTIFISTILPPPIGYRNIEVEIIRE